MKDHLVRLGLRVTLKELRGSIHQVDYQPVLANFLDVISLHHDLPDHIRSDCGGENVAIWRYMIASHNHD